VIKVKQRMNVLHVISALPVGGVENQLCLVLKRYDMARVFPCVCSLSDKGEVGREIEASGIEVVSLDKLRHGFDWSIVKDLMRVIRQRDIQVVRTHQYHANLYGRLAAWLCRVPCIVPSIHNVYTRDRKIHRRVLNNLLGRVSDRVIAVSEAVKDDIVAYDRLSADKITVLYNGVEENRFAGVDATEARSAFRIPADAIVVGTVGRLMHQKGQKYLVESMSVVLKEFPLTVLLIVGDGPAGNELRELAKQRGIENRVIFTGSRKDVPAMLAAMDIFVFPSLWEGLPNALIEAMAAGKTIIATDIKPNREVMGPEHAGVFVPCEDSAAIAAGIRQLLRDRESALRLASAAQERALSRFNINRTVSTYTDLFEEILGRKCGE
jgi:glycosyltransferase involved in cell wall biosynthesis